jgi:lipopolysaccharide transport system permease protein
MMTAAGIGCWLAALTIQYRDIRSVAGFLVQVWMYASPVVYPLSIVPKAYRPLYLLNPMAGVIEGFRSVLVGTTPVPTLALAMAGVVASLLFISGTMYFRHMEQVFADVA